MKSQRLFFIVGAGIIGWLSLGLGCKKTVDFREFSYEKIDMGLSVNDAQLPETLWKRIKGEAVEEHVEHKESGHGEKAEHGKNAESAEAAPSGGHGEAAPAGGGGSLKSILNKNQVELLPTKVYLIEKNRGIFGGSHKELSLNKGGGEIDMARFAGEKRGSFYFIIDPQSMPEDADVRVFFLSRAKKRKVDGEVLGAGCSAYFEITKFYKSALAEGGILSNTTDARYLALLGGTFVFVGITPTGLMHLTQVTVTDSRFPQYLCQGNKE